VALPAAITTGPAAGGTFTVSPKGRAVLSTSNVVCVVSPSTFLMMNTVTAYPVILLFDQ